VHTRDRVYSEKRTCEHFHVFYTIILLLYFIMYACITVYSVLYSILRPTLQHVNLTTEDDS